MGKPSSPSSSFFQDDSRWGKIGFRLMLEIEKKPSFNVYSEHPFIID